MNQSINQMNARRGIDHIGVTACFVVHDGKGNILLQKRSTGARDENGNWDTGGGGVEFGESIEDTICREVREELCTEVIDMQFLTVYDEFRKINDADTHWIAIIYSAQVDPDTVAIGEPHKVDELGWFTSHNLPSPLHSQFWKSYQPALDKGVVQ